MCRSSGNQSGVRCKLPLIIEYRVFSFPPARQLLGHLIQGTDQGEQLEQRTCPLVLDLAAENGHLV